MRGKCAGCSLPLCISYRGVARIIRVPFHKHGGTIAPLASPLLTPVRERTREHSRPQSWYIISYYLIEYFVYYHVATSRFQNHFPINSIHFTPPYVIRILSYPAYCDHKFSCACPIPALYHIAHAHFVLLHVAAFEKWLCVPLPRALAACISASSSNTAKQTSIRNFLALNTDCSSKTNCALWPRVCCKSFASCSYLVYRISHLSSYNLLAPWVWQ